ncbi:MAG: V-type ATP synthase subunit E [Clostridia bacterium]|nr:V-type ATP synthase subunit E [Clostridia bacterium]
MSGLEKIIARLQEECLAQCDEIRLSAAEKAAGILARAEADGNETVKKYEADAKKKTEQILSRARSAAAMESRTDLLREKTALTDGVLAEAKRTVKEAPAQEYFSMLSALIEKNVQPGPGVLFFGRDDLARLPQDFASGLPAGVTLSDIPADIPDGFLLKYGDVEINCALDALFNSARDELKRRAAETLFA